MSESSSENKRGSKFLPEEQVKWDYTSREGTLFLGAAVLGLNLLVVLAFVLYRYVPSVHEFFSGRALS